MGRNSSRLAEVVSREGFHWGADSEAYHSAADKGMEVQWQKILKSFFDRHPFDLTRSIDFAAGFGRNSRKLLEIGAQHVTAVDVNPDCIAALRSSLPPERTAIVQNNGADLSQLESEAYTFLYSFDAMVHFDIEIVFAYMPEFARVLRRGSYALIHHSNYTDSPGSDFQKNPHWRNYMSAGIFQHSAIRSGLIVIEQKILTWGDDPDLDCITILRKD